LWHKAQDLSQEGVNRLGRLGVPLDRFLALGGELSAIRAKLLWSRINTFRIVLQGHGAAMEIAANGGERDERQLDGVVADKLTDLVETANLFVVGDPNLIDLDARRSGPQELAAAKAEVALAAPIIELAVADRRMTTAAAQEVVQEQINNVLTADDTLAGRQAAELGAKTTRNYVGALLRVYRVVRAVTVGAGKGVIEGVYRDRGRRLLEAGISDGQHVISATSQFIAENAAVLIRYVQLTFNNIDLVRIIEIIAGWF
jgi:hypothetical protein